MEAAYSPNSYDDLPDDSPGGDCPNHGPHSNDDCPKCDDDDDSSSDDEEYD